MAEEPIGLVLAGGGARAAYEAGALAELLPALEARGERVEIVVGTSAGALNAAFLAANADAAGIQIGDDAERLWRSITWGDVVAPLWGPGTFGRLGRYLLQVGGVPRVELDSLLDPAPLRETLSRLIALERIPANVAAGHLRSAAVVATANASGWSVVFCTGGDIPPLDRSRGIEYAPAALNLDHLLASAAIPTIFPAVHVREPRPVAGWYFDGGTPLNTPIKPALRLGAKRVAVIGLHSINADDGAIAAGGRPDIFEGAAHVLEGLLASPLAHDLCTLSHINDLLGRCPEPPPPPPEIIPFIFVALGGRATIGELAVEIFNECYAGRPNRSASIVLLERLIDGTADAIHGELLSHLLFAPEFADALLELGRDDARRWLSAPHDDGPWQVGPLVPRD